jgi:3-oxoacyl-[acyl-carrier protein] reductase
MSVVITGGEGGLAKAATAVFGDFYPVNAPGRRELDVTDPDAVRSWFSGRTVELLICNAGAVRDTPLASMDEATWDDLMEINLCGAARCAAAAIPGMIERGQGHLLFLSSFSAIHPPAGQAAYAAAKAGLLGLARSLARELGPQGIRVNTVLPGYLETPMTAAVTPKRRERVLADHLLGSFNTVGATARFLLHLHRDLPHTSGQVFQLDSRIG